MAWKYALLVFILFLALRISGMIDANKHLLRIAEKWQSDFTDSENINSEEMVSISKVAEMILEIAGKKLKAKNYNSKL